MTIKILAVLAVVWPSFLFAAQPEAVTAEQIMKSARLAEDGITTLKIEYKQSIKMSYTGQNQLSGGAAYFLKPENIRIEITTPYKQLFVSDGSAVWLYNQEFNQLMKGRWKDLRDSDKALSLSLPKNLFNLGSSIKSLEESCDVEYVGVKDGFYALKFVPKNSDGGYVILVYLTQDDYFPVKTYLLAEGIEVVTDIINYEKNIQLDKDIFKFKKPKGAEILEFNL